MALWIEKNPAAFFSVVGPAYIPEHRSSYTEPRCARRHEAGLLAWLARDFDAKAAAATSVEPLAFH